MLAKNLFPPYGQFDCKEQKGLDVDNKGNPSRVGSPPVTDVVPLPIKSAVVET